MTNKPKRTAPYFPLFVGDYMMDTRKLSLRARGLWTEALMQMWNQKGGAHGRLEGTVEDLSLLISARVSELIPAIKEIAQSGVGDVLINGAASQKRHKNVTCDADVTIDVTSHVTLINRRMVREETSRKNTRLRTRAWRQRMQCDAPGDGAGDAPSNPLHYKKERKKEKKSPENPPPETPPPHAERKRSNARVRIPYELIITDLNERTGSSFSPSTRQTRELISARWKEGFRLSDFKAVHAVKAGQWLGDAERCAYLRPQTLYCGKFEAYLQEAKRNGNGKQRARAQRPTEPDPLELMSRAYDVLSSKGRERFDIFARDTKMSASDIQAVLDRHERELSAQAHGPAQRGGEPKAIGQVLGKTLTGRGGDQE